VILLVLQALTNLSLAPAGPGLPAGWKLTRVAHVSPPTFRVTAGHTLRIETSRQAAFASYRLRRPLRPGQRAGELTWRWRTSTPLPRARLRSRDRDDSPARVLVVFDDGRMLFYSWGSAEPTGDQFLSWTGASRGVVVCRRAEDANGSWYQESRDPFADYRRAFGRAPHPIVAVGIAADTDQLHDHTVAEVSELTWQ
jgi:hypothetical protein